MKSISPAIRESAPGLLVCAALAGVGMALAAWPPISQNLRLSALLLAILLGMAVASLVKIPEGWVAGIKFAQKPLLRAAVAGLGFRLSLNEIIKIGGPAMAVVVLVTAIGFFAVIWLAPLFGIGRKLALLLGVGGSICGASAVVAADTVVRADGEDAAISLGVITLWGTVGIFLYPWLGHALGMLPFDYGLFSGATLHEMAQVVAAGSGYGAEAESVATVVKLARICLLAPMVFGLGWWLRKTGDSGAAEVPLLPWFLVLFVVFAGVNTAAEPLGFQAALKTYVTPVVTFLLAVGMVGIGMQTGWKQLKRAGLRPVALGLVQWVILVAATYGLMVMLAPFFSR